MEDKLRQRLADLRQELSRGEQLLQDLRGQEADLQQKMLRISGAIQVLEEMLAESESEPPAPEAGNEG